MEGMMTFVSLVVIVFGILQIILFFKLWGMTNDIKAIKDKYCQEEQTNIDISNQDEPKENGLYVGDLVLQINTGKQMRIKEYNQKMDKFSCYSQGGVVYEGDFDESELRKFQ